MKKKRKAYKKPTVRTEKVYERKSLACGKATATTFICLSNLKQS